MYLKKNLPILLAILLTLSFSMPMKSQDKQSELIKGQKVSALLKAGEKHKYTVKLEKDQFALFRLEQKGVDALISTVNPDGKKLEDFDSPNGRKGDEIITLFTDKKGNYTLEITALEEKGHQGNYDLVFEKLEPKGITPQKQIDQLFAVFDNPKTPGAAVSVEKDGKIIFKKGYGSADLEHNILITPSTVFHIASLSKQFTAFSILLLEGEGKLSINDDIRKYIPEVPDFGKVITLNELLHHTSGLRDQWDLLAMAGWRLDDIITKEQILRLVSQQKELNFTPGDQFNYCNTGFTLLAEVVARVSGQTFAEFTKTHIFEPLKMTNTLFYDDCEKIVKNRAYSYHADSTGLKKSILSYSTVGATSLFTTAEDLSQWAINFENPVVGKDVIKKMNTRFVLNSGDTISYAMGQGIDKYKGLNIRAHDGADAGYRSSLYRFPDQKFSVNVLSNLASFNPSRMAVRIADIYLKDVEVAEKPKNKPEVNSANNTQINHDTLVAYCGKYQLNPEFIATITLDGENLMAEAPGLSKTRMKVVSSTTFEVEEAQATVIFMRDESGKVSKIKTLMNGQEYISLKLPDSGVIINHDILMSYCGKYELEPGNIATVSLKDETLFVESPGLPQTEMSVVSTEIFYVKAVDAKVTFIKDESGKVTKIKAEMNGGEHFALRLPDIDASQIDLSEYAGEYYSQELSTTYTIVIESGKLTAKQFRTGDVHLTFIKPDQFSGDQWYFGNVQFTRDSNVVNGCKVSTGRVKNLQFVKKGKLVTHGE